MYANLYQYILINILRLLIDLIKLKNINFFADKFKIFF